MIYTHDDFIDQIIQEAQNYVKEDNKTKALIDENLKRLLATGPSLHARDRKYQTAAMRLAIQGRKVACLFLVMNGASLQDCVNGTVLAGNAFLTPYFIDEMKARGLAVDYNQMAAFAAMGGHGELADHYLKQIDKSKRNYNQVAAEAAHSGNHELANVFLNEISDTNLRDYNKVAAHAAYGGHQDLANIFLNNVPVHTRDYNFVASFAVMGGHQAAAEDYLSRIPVGERKYNQVAANAVGRGYQDIADHFLNCIANSKRDYNLMAAQAAKGGFQELADYYLNKITDKTKRNYQFVITNAQKNGNAALVNHFKTLASKQAMSVSSLITPTVASTPASTVIPTLIPTFTPLRVFSNAENRTQSNATLYEQKNRALELRVKQLELQLDAREKELGIKKNQINELNTLLQSAYEEPSDENSHNAVVDGGPSKRAKLT
jgi:rubrerythrin